MIAIRGPRGAGKTAMMLQRIRFDLKADPTTALYLSADHHWFYTRTLAVTADDYAKSGGKWLFINEVHKYPNFAYALRQNPDVGNLRETFMLNQLVNAGLETWFP